MKPRPDSIVTRTVSQRRSETRETVILTAIPALLLGVAIMAAIHIGLTSFSDSRHESSAKLVQVESDKKLDRCKYLAATASGVTYAELDRMTQQADSRPLAVAR